MVGTERHLSFNRLKPFSSRQQRGEAYAEHHRRHLGFDKTLIDGNMQDPIFEEYHR